MARKIEQGLVTMHSDGSIAQVFNDEPWLGIVIAKLESRIYKIVNIGAPTTTVAAKQDDKEFWLSLKQSSLFIQLF